MNFRRARALLLATMMMSAAPTSAQSPEKENDPASPSAPGASAVAPAKTAAPERPSVEVLRQATLAGYHVRKLRQGATIFCKNEAHVGTRFSTESCIDETQLEEFLIRTQSQRDELKNRKGTSTATK